MDGQSRLCCTSSAYLRAPFTTYEPKQHRRSTTPIPGMGWRKQPEYGAWKRKTRPRSGRDDALREPEYGIEHIQHFSHWRRQRGYVQRIQGFSASVCTGSGACGLTRPPQFDIHRLPQLSASMQVTRRPHCNSESDATNQFGVPLPGRCCSWGCVCLPCLGKFADRNHCHDGWSDASGRGRAFRAPFFRRQNRASCPQRRCPLPFRRSTSEVCKNYSRGAELSAESDRESLVTVG